MLTEQEVREQIANKLALDFFVGCLRLPSGVTVLAEAEKEAAKILALLEKAGYVQLDPDQSLPENPYATLMPSGNRLALNAMAQCYEQAQQDLLKADFRKCLK